MFTESFEKVAITVHTGPGTVDLAERKSARKHRIVGARIGGALGVAAGAYAGHKLHRMSPVGKGLTMAAGGAAGGAAGHVAGMLGGHYVSNTRHAMKKEK